MTTPIRFVTRAGAGVVVLATSAVLVVGVGVASAYVSATAKVATTGASGTVVPADDRQAITVSGATASGIALVPGGSAGNLVLTVTNPNPRPLTITALALPNSGNVATCALTLGTISLPISISAVNGAQQTITLSGKISMGTSAAGSCQGQAALSVPVSVTVHD